MLGLLFLGFTELIVVHDARENAFRDCLNIVLSLLSLDVK
jgi:hypothetical protein